MSTYLDIDNYYFHVMLYLILYLNFVCTYYVQFVVLIYTFLLVIITSQIIIIREFPYTKISHLFFLHFSRFGISILKKIIVIFFPYWG